MVASAEMEAVYDYVRAQNKKTEMKLLRRENIELLNELGHGNFGAVYRGRYKYQAKNRTTQEVDVAVKVLKCGDSPTAEVNINTPVSISLRLGRRCSRVKLEFRGTDTDTDTDTDIRDAPVRRH